MKKFAFSLPLIALCLAFSAACFAQSADEPATKDDVILYLRTMRSHDMMQRTMEAQVQTMRDLMREQIMREKGSVPADYEERMTKNMADLIKNMPVDEITEAMIPTYQKHFTHGDIQAMNAFYSSPVGQKVLEQLPLVMREGLQAAMPMLSDYIGKWKERMEQETKDMGKSAAPDAKTKSGNSNAGPAAPVQQ